MKAIHIVYTPMIWADRHWVGLVINLVVRLVEVFDPLTSLYNDAAVLNVKFMEMHLYGDPYPHMLGITDQNVDNLRRLYAMEVYKTLILPAYHASTSP
ncbi:hypothetical protein N665_0813s0012 [Sinapis alba]|nr:hypothetical protein N665_0813s0012 [Sinapis alba]